MISRRSLLTAFMPLASKLASGQVGPQRKPLHAFAGRPLPPDIRPLLDAHAERLDGVGKQRIVMDATLTEKSGTTPVLVIWQLPNHLRVQAVSGPARVITFDGTTATSSRAGGATADDDLLESLAADSLEGLLTAVTSGQGYRLLGRGFVPHPSVVPNYTGPSFDLYDLEARVTERRDRPTRHKRFSFTSGTSLLARVTYRVGTGTVTETVYSDWQVLDGVAVPGRVRRVENEVEVFNLVRGTTRILAGTDQLPFTQR